MRMRKFVPLMAGLLLTSACAGGPATTREKGALTGAALGAGTGAIIGSQTGKAGTGALIGGAIGGLSGAILGGAIQEQEQQRVVRAAPPPGQSGVPAYPQQPTAVSVPGQYHGDPTRGELANATRWRVAVYIDADSAQRKSTPSLWLGPNETQPANLDIGQHRIVAQAYVDTQFGERLVGRSDKTIAVDPRSSGWSLQFGEGDFR
ncbi:MAG: glycine zipper domain-containing protein [Candidatus Methylomirabilales bacterium]